MTIAYWCVLAAGLMPYIWTGIAKFTGPGYNNRKPRVSLEQMEGPRLRAHWAQLNAFEAFPLFAAAVIIAQQQQMGQFQLDALAVTFVAIRVLYGFIYIKDIHLMRTLVWVAGLLCPITIFVMAGL